MGDTALHVAAHNGRVDVAELLIAKGAYVNARRHFGGTPLHCAVWGGRHREVTELLLAKGADVNVEDESGDTPLHYAAGYILGGNRESMVKLLIAKGAVADSKNKLGQTPVDFALTARAFPVVRFLVTKGTAVSNLLVASVMNDSVKASSLIDQGSDVNAKDWRGMSALSCAILQGNKEVAELLSEKGAKPSIHVAAFLGDIEKVKSFIEAGADVNTKDGTGFTPLHCAAMAGHVNVAKLLIDKGAAVSVEPNQGSRTPLYWAIKNKHKDVAKLLIDKGADVSSIHLLYYACWYGYRDFVELFIQKGADANSKYWGDAPSHYAIWGGYADVLELLLAHGADANAKDTDGWPLLHYAAGSGSMDMTKMLLDKGAEPNVREDKGAQTPLHRAADKGHAAVAELLIIHGADVTAKDNQGRIPLSLAKEKGHTEIVDLLRKHSESVAVKTDSKALKVLFIGNSYTGGIRGNLDSLIGVSPYSESTLEYAVKGGWTLQQHLNDVSTISRIKANKWDYVVLQEQSKAPTLPEKCDDFYNAVVKLSTIIRQYGSRPVLYMTWGRRDKDEENPQINPDYETMQMRLTKAYTDAARKANALIAPVGEAWRAVRRERLQLGSQLYRDDGSHPSEKGAYLAACVFYATLFKADPMQLNFNSSLSVGEAEYLKAKAVEAVRSINRDKDSPAP